MYEQASSDLNRADNASQGIAEQKDSDLENPKNQPSRALRRLIILLTASVAALVGLGIWNWPKRPEPSLQAIVAERLAELNANTEKEVVGNLGGLRVTFPPGFAELVEYEGDPGFGEKRKGPAPRRTHESLITSMGFEVRYPEFVMMNVKERREDKRRHSLSTTPWIDVTINAGSRFGNGNFFSNSFNHLNDDEKFRYAALPERYFDLEVYTPTMIDKSLRQYHAETKSYRSSMRDRDYLFHRDEAGNIDVLIRCSNVAHDAATCLHTFYVGMPLRIEVTLSYRRGLLPHWLQMQEKTKELTLSFQNSKI